MTIAEARALIEENIRKQSDEDRISALETRQVLLAMLDATEALVSGSVGTVIPYIGENGNWWVGDLDTGKKPIAVIGGLKKGMTVIWDITQDVPAGCVLTHEHAGETINGVKIPSYARKVPLGFDPSSSPTPVDITAAEAWFHYKYP